MPRAPAQEVQLKVVFARDRQAACKIGVRPLIAILPDMNDWNDYGFRFYAYMLVLTSDGGPGTLLPIRLMFEGRQKTGEFLEKMHDERGPIVPTSAVDIPFCTLQNEADQYATFTGLLGFDAAVVGLRQVHDVVLARLEEEPSDVLALAETSEFHLGMIRTASRYTALRRGGRFLRPTPPPAIADAAQGFSLEVTLPAQEAPTLIRFNFEPDEIFQDRACVLIGSNGVGKTQLLSQLINTLLQTAAYETSESTALKPVPRFSRTLVFSSVPTDPYPKSIPPWMGLDYEYFAVAADPRPLGAAFMTAVLDCLRTDGSNFSAGAGETTRLRLLQAAMEPLGFWDGLRLPLRADINKANLPPFDEIEGRRYAGVDRSMSEQQKNQLAAAVDRTEPAVVLTGTGDRRRLSSGELAMAQFAAQVVAAVERGSLLLLDEPETHLHPNYIAVLMDVLQELLARTRSVAIIATHSAYVMRETPRQRVSVLHREGGAVMVDNPRIQTFGANIDDLSRFVFLDGEISPRYRKSLAQWAASEGKRLGIDQVVERHGDRLSPVILALIAREILNERSRTNGGGGA